MSVWIAETLIATTLLMALVMLLRRPVVRWLGVRAAYMLWALPLARMLLPALPSEVVQPSPLHVAVDQAGLAGYIDLTQAPVVTDSAPSFPWLEAGIALWFTGLLLFVMVQASGYFRFSRHMLHGATDLGREGRIRIITSPQASGPLAFGVFRPFIVLPVDFGLRYDAQEQDMAIAHERAHHQRGDLVANMVALAMLGVHWCNPVAWFAYRAYRDDQEMACDARVLGVYGPESVQSYGRAILKAAGGRQFAGACHLTRIETLKGRLKMLSTHDVSLQRINWGIAAVAIVTASGLALTASGSRAAQEMAAITDKVQAADFGRLKDLVAQPVQANAAVVANDARAREPSKLAASAMPSVSASDWIPPAAPAEPIPPAADMSVPTPPAPPAPPVVRSENGRMTVTYANGRTETHRVPTQAEIQRMVPKVDVREGCDGTKGQTTSHREWTDGSGQRHVRVRICNEAIEAQARLGQLQAESQARRAEAAARRAEMKSQAADRWAKWQGEAQARRAEEQARLAEVQAERQAAIAERDGARYERMGKLAAKRGLMNARVQIANSRMPAKDQAEALRDIDDEIAALDRDN